MPRAAKPKGAKGDTDSKPYPTTPPPTSSSAQQTPSSSPSKKPKGWTKADKIKLLLEVIGSQKADFELIKDKLEGRTKSQVYDQWRQPVLPALKSHGSVEGARTSE